MKSFSSNSSVNNFCTFLHSWHMIFLLKRFDSLKISPVSFTFVPTTGFSLLLRFQYSIFLRLFKCQRTWSLELNLHIDTSICYYSLRTFNALVNMNLFEPENSNYANNSTYLPKLRCQNVNSISSSISYLSSWSSHLIRKIRLCYQLVLQFYSSINHHSHVFTT